MINSSFFKQFNNFLSKHFITSLGICGFIGALIYSLTLGSSPIIPSNQLTLPASSPFKHNISGSGFVEANSRNIAVGSFKSGIVSEVFVKEGDIVKQDDPLFSLDHRTELAQITANEKQVDAAAHSIAVAQANLADAEDQLARTKNLKVGVLSQEEVQKRNFAVQRAVAQLKLEQSKYEQAKEQLALSKIALDKLTIKAPIPGLVLKVRICPGEYINETVQTLSPITLGNHCPLHVRVQVDENDVWRFHPEAKAVAYLKGNKDINFNLSFVRLEPYAQPKRQLSGDTSELIDTRIIEIVYRMEENPHKVFIGQQLDVFIETSQDYSKSGQNMS